MNREERDKLRKSVHEATAETKIFTDDGVKLLVIDPKNVNDLLDTVDHLEAGRGDDADSICHYRNLAIELGAKPTDMLNKWDRSLVERWPELQQQLRDQRENTVADHRQEVSDVWAENERLEGLLKPLVETEPYPWGVIARCCYCLEEAGHADDCPWLAAKQAIQ